MPYQSVKLIPGINVQYTPALNEGGWSTGSFIRFRDGLPQKLGGWEKFYRYSVGSPIRALCAWQDLNGTDYLGVGAEQSLQVLSGGTPLNITPQTRVSQPPPDFSVTSGSSIVTVVDAGSDVSIYDAVYFATQVSIGGLILSGVYQVETDIGTTSYTFDAGANAAATVANGGDLPEFTTASGSSQITVVFPDHGLFVGAQASFAVPTTVGGLTVQGSYLVTSVIDVDTYTISATEQASATDTATMNGGDAYLLYYVSIGPLPAGSGWGIGAWGSGGWGTGSTNPFVPGTPITASNWTLDNWGEILLACPADGAIFTWRPRSGFSNASIIPEAPNVNGGIFVAMPQQMIISWASSYNGVQDPLLIRWCDASDYTVWIGTDDNQAGDYRIPRGSRIVGGLQGPQRCFIWTDLALWSMTYTGSDFVWSLDQVGMGCGLLGRHAAAVMAGVVYWMSDGNFFQVSDNGVTQIPCPVWDAVFQNIDMTYADRITAAANSEFSEMTWFYPSATGGGAVDSFVTYAAGQGAWTYGALARTAWIDQSVLGNPIGADAQGYIYQHEVGYDADGVPLVNYVESGWFMLTEGDPLVFVDMLLPDFKYGIYSGASTAEIQVTVSTADYPGATITNHGPYTMTQAREFVGLRARGRMAKIRIGSQDMGSFWRLGNLRYRAAQAGRR